MNDRRLTNLGLGGYVFIGTVAVLIPAVMPFIADEYTAAGLTIATIGLIFPARAVGGILGNLLCGVGSDLLGRLRLVWVSALLLAASLGLAAVATPWILFLTGFALVSAAMGALATAINALVADVNRDARARMLNILHGIYGAGAAVSPLIIGALIDGGLPWRWALAGTGFIWLIYGLIACHFDRAAPRSESPRKIQKTDLRMLGERPFLALFLIAFIYNGVAWSLLGWIAIFMQRAAGFSTFLSVAVISIFYAALTLGRFICAAYAERFGYALTLLVLASGITLTYPLVVLDLSPVLAVTGVFLTGLGLSGLFPTAMAYGVRMYPKQTGTVSGTLNVAMTVGMMIPPLWTGLIAEQWSFQVALAVNYVMVPPLVLIALYLRRIETLPNKPI